MKTVIGRFVLALVLFAGAAACVAEAGHARRVAEAYRRLATLQYAHGSDAAADEGTAADGLPWPLGTLQDETRRHRAISAYWQSQYDTLVDPAGLVNAYGPGAAANPDLLFVAANAAFRAGQRRSGEDRAVALQRLDRAIEAYAGVLRAAPDYADASFNYEFVARFRDALARGRPAPGARAQAGPAIVPSPDLPVGPTIHGLPGGPPPRTPGSQFNIIAPMGSEEREEASPGEGDTPRRRG